MTPHSFFTLFTLAFLSLAPLSTSYASSFEKQRYGNYKKKKPHSAVHNFRIHTKKFNPYNSAALVAWEPKKKMAAQTSPQSQKKSSFYNPMLKVKKFNPFNNAALAMWEPKKKMAAQTSPQSQKKYSFYNAPIKPIKSNHFREKEYANDWESPKHFYTKSSKPFKRTSVKPKNKQLEPNTLHIKVKKPTIRRNYNLTDGFFVLDNMLKKNFGINRVNKMYFFSPETHKDSLHHQLQFFSMLIENQAIWEYSENHDTKAALIDFLLVDGSTRIVVYKKFDNHWRPLDILPYTQKLLLKKWSPSLYEKIKEAIPIAFGRTYYPIPTFFKGIPFLQEKNKGLSDVINELYQVAICPHTKDIKVTYDITPYLNRQIGTVELYVVLTKIQKKKMTFIGFKTFYDAVKKVYRILNKYKDSKLKNINAIIKRENFFFQGMLGYKYHYNNDGLLCLSSPILEESKLPKAQCLADNTDNYSAYASSENSPSHCQINTLNDT